MLDITEKRLTKLKELGFTPRTVLDIGAYIGSWTQMAKNIWPHSNFIMIEANEEVAPAKAVVALLGRSEGNRAYYSTQNEFKTGNSIFLEQTSYFKDCKKRILNMQTLDCLVLKNKWKNIDFVKIDTQGSELEIIVGGLNSVKKTEFILLETQNLTYNEGAPKTLEVMNKMDELGFTLFDITELHHIPTGEMQGVDMLFARKDSKFIKKGLLW